MINPSTQKMPCFPLIFTRQHCKKMGLVQKNAGSDKKKTTLIIHWSTYLSKWFSVIEILNTIMRISVLTKDIHIHIALERNRCQVPYKCLLLFNSQKRTLK